MSVIANSVVKGVEVESEINGEHTMQCFRHATYQTCGLCRHMPVESHALTIQTWDFYGGNMPKESADCI